MPLGIGAREIVEIMVGVIAVLGGVVAIVRGAVSGITRQNGKLIEGLLKNQDALSLTITNHMHEDQVVLIKLAENMAVQTEVLKNIRSDTVRMEETQRRIYENQVRSDARHEVRNREERVERSEAHAERESPRSVKVVNRPEAPVPVKEQNKKDSA